MSFLPVCSSDPGPDGVCPSGSLTWVDSSSFSALPELSPGEIASLMGSFLVLFAIAVGIRFIIKQFIK